MKKILLPFVLILLSYSVNAQWVTQTSGVTVSLRSVSVVDANNAWISGGSGVVLRTTNGGTTWTSVGSIAMTGTQYIYAIDANIALVSSNPAAGGQLFRTTDGGTNWTLVLEQAGGFFDGIDMSTSTTGFMVGDPVGGRWSLFKTTDAGASWDSSGLYIPQAGTEAGWNNSIVTMGSKIYFGTDNSRLYYSSNGGASFSAMTIPLTNSFAICFNSQTRAIVGGSSEGLISTKDGGTTWTGLTALSTGTIYSVAGYSEHWYHTRGTAFFESTDDGATWDTVMVTAGTAYHMSRARNLADVGYVVGGTGFIIKGTNVGLPVELASFNASAANDVVELNWITSTEINNRGFEIERSTGTDFITVGFVKGAGTTTEKQTYTFSDKVAPGIYNYRLKQVDFNGNSEYSDPVQVDVSGSFSYVLDQNYPNPFNPATTIRFVNKETEHVTLKVYNVLGDEIAVLLNEQINAGAHEYYFNGSSFASGIYFYTLTAGSFTETRKMMLMK